MKGHYTKFLDKEGDKDYDPPATLSNILAAKTNYQLAMSEEDKVKPILKKTAAERGYIYNLPLLNERIEIWKANGCKRVRVMPEQSVL